MKLDADVSLGFTFSCSIRACKQMLRRRAGQCPITKESRNLERSIHFPTKTLAPKSR